MFVRQMLACGINSTPFIALIAVAVGLTVVVQTQVWVGKLGQTERLGSLLVALVARELGPLFANLVLIIKSGSATASELGLMKTSGEVRLLQANGVEPFLYLVLPRVYAFALSTFCQTVFFILICLISGYVFAALSGLTTLGPTVFSQQVLKSLQWIDILNIIGKSLLPAIATGVICCVEGLSLHRDVSSVPRAVAHALSRSLIALVLVSATLSLLSYVGL